MTIYVDASYEYNKFAMCSIVFENGTARSFFIPIKFKLDGKWFNTNQIIAEFYAIYAAITNCKTDNITIYTDNESISKMLNNQAMASSGMTSAFINIIRKMCLSRNIEIKYISRKLNKRANDLSLFMLRAIKGMKTKSSILNAENIYKVQMIPIDYSLTRRSELYNIYINKDVEISYDGNSYLIKDGYCTNCFNGFQFKEAFNWIKHVRRVIS